MLFRMNRSFMSWSRCPVGCAGDGSLRPQARKEPSVHPDSRNSQRPAGAAPCIFEFGERELGISINIRRFGNVALGLLMIRIIRDIAE
jgi:hypothetical protein